MSNGKLSGDFQNPGAVGNIQRFLRIKSMPLAHGMPMSCVQKGILWRRLVSSYWHVAKPTTLDTIIAIGFRRMVNVIHMHVYLSRSLNEALIYARADRYICLPLFFKINDNRNNKHQKLRTPVLSATGKEREVAAGSIIYVIVHSCLTSMTIWAYIVTHSIGCRLLYRASYLLPGDQMTNNRISTIHLQCKRSARMKLTNFYCTLKLPEGMTMAYTSFTLL